MIDQITGRWAISGIGIYLALAITILFFGTTEKWLTNALIQLLLSSSLICFYYTFYKQGLQYPDRAIEKPFSKLIGFILASFILTALPELLQLLGWVIKPWLAKILELVSGFSLVLSIAFALHYYSLLIHRKKTIHVIRLWNAFLVLLGLALLVEVIPFFNFPFFRELIWWSGLFLIVPLSLQIKWIALLKSDEKWLSVFYLLALNCMFLGILRALFSNNLIVFGLEFAPNNLVLLLCLMFISLYSIFGLLALIFTIPVSSVIEDQKAEILSYQEISDVLYRQNTLESALSRVFELAFKNTQSDAGWLMQYSSKNGKTLSSTSITEEEIRQITELVRIEELLAIEPERGYYYFNDLARQAENNSGVNLPFKSLLVLPIYGKKGALKATIALLKSFISGYDNDMISLSRSYAEQVQFAVEKAHLMEQTIQDARFKEEIEIATKVQEALMPANFPSNQFCEIAAVNITAKEVGGDYYDYCFIDDSRIAVVIGDVSGKGASAAFHMAQMKGIFQSLMQLCLPADDFLIMANQALSKCLEKNIFITLTYADFNFDEDILTYSRAGHCPMIYYSSRQKEAQFMAGDGLGLGIIRNSSYVNHVDTRVIDLIRDDVILLYTDGLVEGRRQNEEEYGYTRLLNSFLSHTEKTAEEIKDAVFQDFLLFTEGSERHDDTALMIIKIK